MDDDSSSNETREGEPSSPASNREFTFQLLIVHGSRVLTTVIWAVLIAFAISVIAAAVALTWWLHLLLAAIPPTGVAGILARKFWTYRKTTQKRVRELEDTIKTQDGTIKALQSSIQSLPETGKNERRP
jgi:membrane protein implicated in regulation of membrane protease activity